MEPHANEMLILFDAMPVLEIIGSLCNPYSDLVDDNFNCKELRALGTEKEHCTKDPHTGACCGPYRRI
jgi:NRPS condensation-like uncharacterized protein